MRIFVKTHKHKNVNAQMRKYVKMYLRITAFMYLRIYAKKVKKKLIQNVLKEVGKSWLCKKGCSLAF